MLVHIVTSSSYFDVNKTVALRTSKPVHTAVLVFDTQYPLPFGRESAQFLHEASIFSNSHICLTVPREVKLASPVKPVMALS